MPHHTILTEARDHRPPVYSGGVVCLIALATLIAGLVPGSHGRHPGRAESLAHPGPDLG